MKKSRKVLVACEYSGRVRSAFRAKGCEAFSCDLLDDDHGSEQHYKEDCMEVIAREPWDLIVAHPPCTALAVSGNRWYANTEEREAALVWTMDLWALMTAQSKFVAMENPVGAISTYWRPPDQYIQPWQFGHPESKKTGLWLRNLPPLVPTHEKPDKVEQRIWKMPPSEDRWKKRSETYEGIARAMADQWSPLL